MLIKEFFDVLNIQDENGKADVIQSFMGDDCLGSYCNNGTIKLYFNGGLRKKIETRLNNININLPIKF